MFWQHILTWEQDEPSGHIPPPPYEGAEMYCPCSYLWWRWCEQKFVVCYMLRIEDWEDWLGRVPRQAWLPHTVGVAIMCSQPCSEGPCIRCKAWNLWRIHVKAKTYRRILDTNLGPERGKEPPSEDDRWLVMQFMSWYACTRHTVSSRRSSRRATRYESRLCTRLPMSICSRVSSVKTHTTPWSLYQSLKFDQRRRLDTFFRFHINEGLRLQDIHNFPSPKLQTRGSVMKWRLLLAQGTGMCMG